MPYKSEFYDHIYVDDSARPSVLHYRIAFTNAAHPLVVLELVHRDAAFQSPSDSDAVRDAVLNHIGDSRLHGIRVSDLRLVVTDGKGRHMYAVEVDLGDYLRRGNPYDAGTVAAARGGLRETIAVRSENIVLGRTRVQTIHSSPVPLTKEVAAALA